MTRRRRKRWRDSRDTMPARRRRRRARRRDTPRGGAAYYPMVVDTQSARRGVRMRLLGALVAVSVTLASLIFAGASALSTFGATFALAVGICAFGAAVALLLSARQEEEVHALAARLDGPVASYPEVDVYPQVDPQRGRAAGARPLALPAPPHAELDQDLYLCLRPGRRGGVRVYHRVDPGTRAASPTTHTAILGANKTDGSL